MQQQKQPTKAGRILRSVVRVLGIVGKSAGLGIVDAVPGLAQYVATATSDRRLLDVNKPTRLLSGWGALLLIVYMFLRGLFGDLEPSEAWALVRVALGLPL